MRHHFIFVIGLLFSLTPTHSYAEIDVPQYTCEIIPRHDSPSLAQCFMQVGQVDVYSADQRELAVAKQKVLANAVKAYSAKEVNDLLTTRDNNLQTVKTSLEQSMKALESSLPNAIGKKVDESIKRNLREVLSNLIQNDPELQNAIAEILKRR